MTRHLVKTALAVSVALLTAAPALARGWDCDMVGGGDDPAHYIAHFRLRGRDIIEPHWPTTVVYRILSDEHGMLVAAHSFTHPRSERGEAGAVVTILILNTHTGRLRRATTATGEETDSVRFGTCQER